MIAAALLAAGALVGGESSPAPAREAVVTASVENLYSAPDEAKDVVSQATLGEVVEVLVIAPAVPDTPVGVKVIRLGVLKFARFSRLKISARHCTFQPS